MEHIFPIHYAWLIPVLPLVGAAISGLFGAKWLKQQSHWPIWLTVGFSALLSFCLLAQMLQRAHGEGAELSATVNYFTWFRAGDLVVNWGYFFDPLTAVMLCVVTGVGFFITVFAA